jgi:hypothetical protein
MGWTYIANFFEYIKAWVACGEIIIIIIIIIIIYTFCDPRLLSIYKLKGQTLLTMRSSTAAIFLVMLATSISAMPSKAPNAEHLKVVAEDARTGQSDANPALHTKEYADSTESYAMQAYKETSAYYNQFGAALAKQFGRDPRGKTGSTDGKRS